MAEGRRIRVKFTVPFPGHFFTDDVKIEKSRHAMGEWVLNVDAPWKMHMNTKISGCRPDKNNKGAAVKTEIGTSVHKGRLVPAASDISRGIYRRLSLNRSAPPQKQALPASVA